ncbi:MAG: hypothetical protein BWY68_00617 [bacterium ADurb.Bin400]|nr:MAG: hypothetical protein BWY68_00617 [bacterium ADurb.Bin400]
MDGFEEEQARVYETVLGITWELNYQFAETERGQPFVLVTDGRSRTNTIRVNRRLRTQPYYQHHLARELCRAKLAELVDPVVASRVVASPVPLQIDQVKLKQFTYAWQISDLWVLDIMAQHWKLLVAEDLALLDHRFQQAMRGNSWGEVEPLEWLAIIAESMAMSSRYHMQMLQHNALVDGIDARYACPPGQRFKDTLDKVAEVFLTHPRMTGDRDTDIRALEGAIQQLVGVMALPINPAVVRVSSDGSYAWAL